MSYDTTLADQIRAELGERPDVTERQMFGGIGFMVGGNMAVGVAGDDLLVRVGSDGHDEAMALPGAKPFAQSPRPMRGWVSVGPDGLATDEALRDWIARGVAYAASLPPK
jgi:TfoX/Sxy family transcriptional regulator of competence genes